MKSGEQNHVEPNCSGGGASEDHVAIKKCLNTFGQSVWAVMAKVTYINYKLICDLRNNTLSTIRLVMQIICSAHVEYTYSTDNKFGIIGSLYFHCRHQNYK